MLIPKGKKLVWKGIKYLPGQKVIPAHKPIIRALLKLRGAAPIESEMDKPKAETPIRDTIPAPKPVLEKPPQTIESKE